MRADSDFFAKDLNAVGARIPYFDSRLMARTKNALHNYCT
jgi:hypothetical protein